MPTARPAARFAAAFLAMITPALARAELVCPGAIETYGLAPPPLVLGSPAVVTPDLFGPAPGLPSLDAAPRPNAPSMPGPSPITLAPPPPEHAVLIQVSQTIHPAAPLATIARIQPATQDWPRRLDSLTSAASFAGITAAGAIIGLAIRKLPR